MGAYLTTDGVSLGGNGIRPDVRTEDDPDRPRDEAVQTALSVLASEL